MCSDVSIACAGVGKVYRIYDRPSDRVKEVLIGGRYGEDFWALQDVSFEVRRGETLGVVGRNGSGKSTLLQLICGTVAASTGRIEVHGRVAALLELGAGFNPDFTGRENVVLSASILGLTAAEIESRMAAIEAFAGIGVFMDRPVRRYSSGMYARLAFAVCAHVDADILVVDEILAVGDAAFQQRCMRFLHGFRQRGTLIFVSHDEAAVLALCERALWLEGGRTQALGPSRDVCRRYLAALARTAGGEEGFSHGGAELARPAALPDPRWAGANPIEIFDFDPDGLWHGHGGATILQAGFWSPEGVPMRTAHGGEEVELRIVCRADRRIERPIVGFLLRNKLGQNLFGDNTYTTYRLDPPAFAPGQNFTARFRFNLPYLPSGDYDLTTAVTEGLQRGAIHLHWIEQAVTLRVRQSPVLRGAMGLAMRSISLYEGL